MASKANSVWGIEIGQSAIKALRCTLNGGEVVADAFDFIEYPKILSQPDAEPEVLLADALEQLTGRNDFRNARVIVSVPGQQGLVKFFKPPPIVLGRIPALVGYEAKQQIPFDLDDVIWDYQMMPGANVDDGYALESEIGLFAMKRDAVYRAMRPYTNVDIEADFVQLAPLAIYNAYTYDRLADEIEGAIYDMDSPPPSRLILSIGTDSTDLVVTNGFRMWQRSIPIGGNHFTRQLSKELKLTFAKAEHVKRNALQADDPKLVFQAMRPIFNDVHSEINRSISYFKQINKKSTIGSVLLVGNTAKLPGLQAYLTKSLGMDVEALERFERLGGSEITGSPTFKENVPALAVCYGLCLQALGRGPAKTNLLPKEIAIDRMVRSKKPLVAAAAAVLLAGFAINFSMAFASYKDVEPELWSSAEQSASSLDTTSRSLITEDDNQKSTIEKLQAIGEELGAGSERRVLWLELLTGINQSLNRDPSYADLTFEQLPPSERGDFHITKIDCKFMDDLGKYFNDAAQARYQSEDAARRNLLGLTDTDPADATDQPDGAAPTAPAQVTGPGWVVQLTGYHYHNGVRGDEGTDFIRKHLINALETGIVELPGPDGEAIKFTLKELGVAYPMLMSEAVIQSEKIGNPRYERFGGKRPAAGGDEEMEGGYGQAYGATAAAEPTVIKDDEGNVLEPFFDVRRADFTVQFIWRERTLKQRLDWRADPNFDPQAIPPIETGTGVL